MKDRKNLAIGLGVAAGAAGLIYLVTRPEAVECEIDADCPRGYKCVNGKCVPEVVEGISFSVEVYNIPSYASEAYEWFITYGGENYGMWTPIGSPIILENVPESGQLQATLTGGPYKNWTFRTTRTFRDGESYRFNLEADIIEGPGIVLTDLVVEPRTVNVGEPVSISVTAINTGDTSESRGVTFIINDEVIESKTVSLEPGESKELSIVVTPSEPGIYDVIVNELSGRFGVTTAYPGYVCLMSLLLDPSEMEYRTVSLSYYSFKMTGFACQPATGYGEQRAYRFYIGGKYWRKRYVPPNRYTITPEGCIPFEMWFPNFVGINTPLERGTHIITCTSGEFDLGDTGLRVTII